MISSFPVLRADVLLSAIYLKSPHRLKCGDTQTIYESGRSNSANMILFGTDNPYLEDYACLPNQSPKSCCPDLFL